MFILYFLFVVLSAFNQGEGGGNLGVDPYCLSYLILTEDL